MKTKRKQVPKVAKKRKTSLFNRFKFRTNLSKFTAVFFAFIIAGFGVYWLSSSFAASTATVSYSGNLGGKGKNAVTSRSYEVNPTASGDLTATLSFNSKRLKSATLELRDSAGIVLSRLSQNSSPIVIKQTVSKGKYTVTASSSSSGSYDLSITYPIEEITTTLPPPSTTTRVTSDRADDKTGNQVHVMYVLPSDGVDRSYDTDGTLATSVNAYTKWLASKTGGQALRVDTYQGAMDITFYKLNRTDSQMKSYGAYVRDEIEKELKAAGKIKSGKIYAVYYDGGSNYACGGGAWPPDLPGQVAALYLKGAYSGVNCDSTKFTTSDSSPGYREYAMLHELLHTLGFVAKCAKNHTQSGHTGDDSRDLMYAGNQAWQPSILDAGNNDYYKHGISGCLDLANSPYIGTN